MSKENDRNDMQEQEKIEKLRQRADVSYEEARDALRACEGDLLDAMVYLERLGQAKAPEQTTFSTNAEEKRSYENVPEAVVRSQNENSDPSFGEQLGHLLKTAFQKSLDNSLVVSHRGEEKFRLPILVVVLLFLVFNFGVIVALVVSLFFDVKYQFAGKDDLSKVNQVMDEAGTKATSWMADNYRNGNASERQAARKAKREEDKVTRKKQEAADKAARKAQEAADKAARLAAEAAEKAARLAQKAADKVSTEANKHSHDKEEEIDTSIRHETFAEKEVNDLKKKYDDADDDQQ